MFIVVLGDEQFIELIYELASFGWW